MQEQRGRELVCCWDYEVVLEKGWRFFLPFFLFLSATYKDFSNSSSEPRWMVNAENRKRNVFENKVEKSRVATE